MTNPMVLYRSLKASALGEDKPISKHRAARYLSISYSLVVSIESGSRDISRATARKICGDPDVGSRFNQGELLLWAGEASCNKAA